MYTFDDFCAYEHKDLLEPVIELIEGIEDSFFDVTSVNENGYTHQTIPTQHKAYGYKLGRVYGREMFDEDDLPSLYKAAFKDLKLDNIIKTYSPIDDEQWELTDIWDAKGLTITTEGLRYLYFSEYETDRLNILQRAVEACQMVGIPVIDKLCIRLCRECLQLEKEGNRCLA